MATSPYCCVHCGHSLERLCRKERSVSLPLPCGSCGATVADPYLLSDGAHLAIDLCLFRGAAFRHILRNDSNLRLFSSPSWFNAARLVLCLFALDMHYNWTAVEAMQSGRGEEDNGGALLWHTACLTASGTLAQLAVPLVYFRDQQPIALQAWLLSLFGKFFSLLLQTWTQDIQFRCAIVCVTLASNLEVARLLGARRPRLLVGTSFTLKAAVTLLLLGSRPTWIETFTLL